MRELYQLNIEQPILIYESFEPNSSGSSGSLETEQVKSILNCLSQSLNTESKKMINKAIIEQILEQINSLETVLNLVANLPLFFGYNHHQNVNYFYSYSELQELKQKFLLFKGSKKDYETPIYTAVKIALPECELIFIESKIAQNLAKTSTLKNIPEFNPQSCLQLLTTKPVLGNSSQRTKLLQELINHV